jgi:uncharacterized membrane protein YfcA
VNWSEQLVLIVVSLTANGFSAFAGGGAGLLQLPALIFLGLPFGVALATHKVATVALGFGATLRHWRARRLERGFTLYILGCGLPGVVLGAHLALELPDRVAQVALGILTLALGLYSFLRKELGQSFTPCRRDLRGYALGALALFTIGILNGALASGTGLFVTLWLVRWFGLDYQRAIAYTLVLVGLFWNGAGALTLSTLARVQWDWLPALIAGAVVGGYLGAHFALKQGNRWIKRAFETVTVLVGVKLLLG